MKILTRTGYFAGGLVIVASAIRWSITYVDPSQAIFGAAIGATILGASYVYQRLVDLTEDIKDVNKGLDALNLWTRDQLKKLGWKE